MRAHALAVAAVVLAACGTDEPPAPEATLEQLLDPTECAECHPNHYEEWAGSMHAYASTDPVFRAMNARGQRETGGDLGDFCIRCHAPMAVETGATTDGLNIAELPGHLQGVTCYFCHSAVAVEDTHNNPLVLAEDRVMRAGIFDPVRNTFHAAEGSTLHDRTVLESASLCGACHDIVTPNDVHLERTFAEWNASLYSNPDSGQQLTCGGCHMPGRDGVAADAPGVVQRRVHDHRMPGVDIALEPFPDAEAQREAVQRALDTTINVQVCVDLLPGSELATVTLENIAAGHNWPSGAAHDRRAWVEVVAYDGDTVIFESGVVPEGVAVRSVDDPNLWTIGDRGLGPDGEEAHMFWDITDIESDQLPAPTALFPFEPGYVDTHVSRDYPLPSRPTRITARVHLRPIGLDVLDDLIDSGDLAEGVRDAMPTFTLAGSEVEWTEASGQTCAP